MMASAFDEHGMYAGEVAPKPLPLTLDELNDAVRAAVALRQQNRIVVQHPVSEPAAVPNMSGGQTHGE